jgi:DNA-binding transcriptional MerR regulator
MTTRTISWLAHAAGVPISTVRYYERQQVLAPAERSESGYRNYDEDDLEHLQLVLRAKRLGFSLSEITELFGAGQRQSATDVRGAALRKQAELEQTIVELTSVVGRLEQLAAICDVGDPARCADLDLGVNTGNGKASGTAGD